MQANVGCIGTCFIERVVKTHLIRTSFFGLIHRLIRGFQQRIGRGGGARIKRDPNADGNLNALLPHVKWHRQGIDDRLRHKFYIFALLGAGENHGKFIPT